MTFWQKLWKWLEPAMVLSAATGGYVGPELWKEMDRVLRGEESSPGTDRNND